jgi:hypothetical protein
MLWVSFVTQRHHLLPQAGNPGTMCSTKPPTYQLICITRGQSTHLLTATYHLRIDYMSRCTHDCYTPTTKHSCHDNGLGDQLTVTHPCRQTVHSCQYQTLRPLHHNTDRSYSCLSVQYVRCAWRWSCTSERLSAAAAALRNLPWPLLLSPPLRPAWPGTHTPKEHMPHLW